MGNDFVNLKVIYTNVDGISSKRLEITDMLKEKKPMIFCMVETKVKKEVNLELFGWEGYNILRKDRAHKFGGGVCILVHNSLRVKNIEIESDKAEVLAAEITTMEEEKITVIAAYVPPLTGAWTRTSHEEMRNETLVSLERIIRRSERILLCGDFNCKEVDWEGMEPGYEESSWGAKFFEQMTENALFQHIKEATRARGSDNPSRLDLVFTRKEEEIENITLESPLGKGDHVVLICDVWLKYGRNNESMATAVTKLNFKRADIKTMKRLFKEKKWFESSSASNSEGMLEEVLKTYEEVVHKTVPVFQPKIKGKNVWFNDRCRFAKEERDKKWRRLRRRRTERTIEDYHRARNRYTEIRREEEANYEKNIVDKYDSDPKIFYKYINGKTKIKNAIQRLKVDGKILEDEQDMAHILNDQFKSVFVKDDEFWGDVSNRDVHQGPKLNSIVIDRMEVQKKLQSLDVNKAMGPDQMSGWVIKNCAEELSWPICKLFKKSLEEGYVPDKWKEAQIVAIHKGGSKEIPLNYRPVSLLCILIKVLEGMIRDVWIDFLEEGGGLSEKQFGFRKGRSCITNLLSFYSRVIDIIDQKGGWADCVYLDLKKAFDKVSHKRLIWKLEHTGGIGGKLLDWMKSYLSNRKMKTVIRGASSNWAEVVSGVPQGSVLAPLMFLIYINDLPDGVSSYMNMFADDAKIMRQVRNPEDCQKLQQDLDKLHEWSAKWLMEFNADKCHVLEMGKSIHRPHARYNLGGTELLKAESEKDLGIIVRNNLSPEGHINKIVGEGLAIVANVRITFSHLSEPLIKKIIESILRPKLEYAQVTWAPHLKKHIRKLERVQRAATKLVPSLHDKEYQERLQVLKLPSLEERRKRGDMIQLYKCVHQIDRIDRDDFLQLDPDRRTRGGHEMKLRMPGSTTDVKKFSFPARTIRDWNNMPGEVVRARNIHSFKEQYDKWIQVGGTPRV